MPLVAPSQSVNPAAIEELPPLPTPRALAILDIIEGFSLSWLWTSMAIQDIRLRYRGSLLGPLWLTVSTVVMIGAMGVVYAKLFHTDVASYLPFLTVGLIVWGFVFTIITEGCGTFVSVQGVIQQVRLPYSVHAYRLVCRNFIVLGHTAVVIPCVLATFGAPIDWHLVMLVPGLIMLAINGVWISIFFGMAGARFRDVAPIVASFMQVIFFVTPIFWPPGALGPYAGISVLNPLFAAIDIIRAPLLGVAPARFSWAIVIVMTIAGSAMTFALFTRFRARIAFWV